MAVDTYVIYDVCEIENAYNVCFRYCDFDGQITCHFNSILRLSLLTQDVLPDK